MAPGGRDRPPRLIRPSTRRRLAAVAALALLAGSAGCGGDPVGGASPARPARPGTGAPAGDPAAAPTPDPAGTGAPAAAVAGGGARAATPASATLLAAGDVASCRSTGDEATAALLDGLAGTIVTLGDNVYERGAAEEFAACYDPSWGRHRDRTRPAPGNHDYGTPGARGYFDYFGAAAGDPGLGYYSFDLGAWHVVALNSNCGAVGCRRGGAQEAWLRADLAAHPAPCTLAFWHHPRFSSGLHGPNDDVAPLFATLHELGADVVLAGHDHSYERFAPLDPDGRPDAAAGVRSFVVGTGGRSHYAVGPRLAGSEAADGTAFGVLELTLHDGGYDWRFHPAGGSTFSDAGSDRCH